jgi:hypothetical protein
MLLTFGVQLKLIIDQMLEYRGTSAPTANTPQQPPTRDQPPRPFTKLASRYGLPNMEIRRSNSGIQTVDQEFSAYVTGNPSPEHTDPLSFWEVSTCYIILILFDGSDAWLLYIY